MTERETAMDALIRAIIGAQTYACVCEADDCVGGAAVRAAARALVVAELTAWDWRGFKSWADTAFRNYEDDTGYSADSWRHIAMKLATKGSVLEARIQELSQ